MVIHVAMQGLTNPVSQAGGLGYGLLTYSYMTKPHSHYSLACNIAPHRSTTRSLWYDQSPRHSGTKPLNYALHLVARPYPQR